MANFKDSPIFDRTPEGDEYMTRFETFKDLMQFLPSKFKNGKMKLWEPFYGDGGSTKYLRKLGFDVYSKKGVDFFSVTKDDIKRLKIDFIYSNPCFTRKEEVLARLKELDLAFALILPSTVLHTQYLQKTFGDDKDIQLVIPSRKIQYDKVGLEIQKNNASFYSLYLCWKMNLEKPIEITDKNGKKKIMKEKRDIIFFENKITDGSAKTKNVSKVKSPINV